MAYRHPQGSFAWRTMKKAAHAVFVLGVYCWIGNTFYLWFSAYYNPGYGLGARFLLAARDSLYDLPGILFVVFDFCTNVVSVWHRSLVSELGYDLFAVPEFGDIIPGEVSFSFDFLRDFSFDGWKTTSLYGAVIMGAVLSAFQFTLLFVFSLVGVPVGWRYPGVPVFFQTLASLLFGIAGLLAAFWLTLWLFEGSVVASMVGLAVAVFLLWRPLIAGLAMWLMMVIGLPPSILVSLPFIMLRGVFRLATRTGPSSPHRSNEDGPSDTSTGSEYGGAESTDKAPGNVNLPDRSALEERLVAACRKFDLGVEAFKHGLFQQRTLVSRFHALAKKFHPDISGSDHLMAELNADYEFLLQYKGWTR